jgi:hypothetical protein
MAPAAGIQLLTKALSIHQSLYGWFLDQRQVAVQAWKSAISQEITLMPRFLGLTSDETSNCIF